MSAAAPGRFITFEGGEGVGKSTQARLLASALRRVGKVVVLTREPGGAPGAELLRDLLLYRGQDWSPDAEVLLHFAARAEHVARTIRPALAAGQWVISDRFYDSTLAYQGYGQGADREQIQALTGMVGLDPDLTIVLAVSPETAQARLAARGGSDRYERMDAAFHNRVADGFRAVLAAAPTRCVGILAEAEAPVVHAAILRVIEERLGAAGPPNAGERAARPAPVAASCARLRR